MYDTSKHFTVIRVAIVDDDEEFRNGLSWIISQTDGYDLTGIYKNYTDALHGISERLPDVVLMDIGLPGKSGIECVRDLKVQFPQVQFVMQTVYADDENIFQSLRAGASGYLLKKTPSSAFLQAISDAHGGGAPMSGEIARKVLNYFQTPAPRSGPDYQLSEREVEVLKALTEGHSYKSIADKLFVSVHTVRFHLHNIYDKLHVASRAEAVAKVMKEKVL
ncbi:MAG: response regulator transcription factor [Bacteroidetes bacterium]|nr:response regulator transcription factor [Bacteroidota bacterium]